MQTYRVDGKIVYVLPAFLTAQECKTYRTLLDTKFPTNTSVQNVYLQPDVAQDAWATLQKRIPQTVPFGNKPITITGLSPHVTYSKRTYSVLNHLDKPKTPRDRFKLSIYLNTLAKGTGGTAFYTHRYATEPALVVENKEGGAIIFDLRLYHAGVLHDAKKTKYMIGFRLQS